jgi:hypothetical protein
VPLKRAKKKAGRMTRHQPYIDSATKIRKWARKSNPHISFGARLPDYTTHSLNEMEKDEIDFDDLVDTLRTPTVTVIKDVNGELRHQVEGKNIDGREFVFVVNLFDEREEIEIVTAWAKDRR